MSLPGRNEDGAPSSTNGDQCKATSGMGQAAREKRRRRRRVEQQSAAMACGWGSGAGGPNKSDGDLGRSLPENRDGAGEHASETRASRRSGFVYTGALASACTSEEHLHVVLYIGTPSYATSCT